MVYPIVVKLQRKTNTDECKIQDGGFSAGHQGGAH